MRMDLFTHSNNSNNIVVQKIVYPTIRNRIINEIETMQRKKNQQQKQMEIF